MKIAFKRYFVAALVWAALSVGAHGCVSDKFQAQLNEISPFIVKIFNDSSLTEVVRLNRTVLQMKGLHGGVPPVVKVPKTDTEVWAILDNGGTNKDLMARGKAPIGPDGYYVNLHHVFGQEPGPIAEIPQSVHQKETRTLHMMIESGSFRRDKQKRRSYRSFKDAYWKLRAKDF